MVLPKVTRQRLYASKGEPIEITVPEGEPCRTWHRYSIQARRGGRRLGTLFVQELQHRGAQRIAKVVLSDQPTFMAKVSGDTHDASQSIDPDAEKVPEDFQKRLDAESRERWAEHRAETQAAELAAEQSRRFADKVLKLQREAAKLGMDIAPAMERFISEAQGQIVAERKRAA